MTRILRLSLMLFLTVSMMACDKDDDIQELPSLEVTNANLHGTWKLYEWNGELMNDSRYSYIDFDRLEQAFVIYENFSSMYARKLTGKFTIGGSNEDGYTLTGVYDYTDEAWKGYDVNRLTTERLELSESNNPDEVLIYVRCAEIPDDVLYE
ncbi:MAG: lipocalin family protein [Mangrovibacterium sp.]